MSRRCLSSAVDFSFRYVIYKVKHETFVLPKNILHLCGEAHTP